MSEWWTYRPEDFLLFSPRVYWRLFELHNEALWPAQIAAIAEQEGYPGIAEAKRFLPGTQVVVRRDGEVIFWSDPVRVLEARAIVRSGDIEVTHAERVANLGDESAFQARR